MTRYQIGNPNDLRGDDPYFDTLYEAVCAASNRHDESKHKDPIAVWEEGTDILPFIVRLFVFSQEFVPA